MIGELIANGVSLDLDNVLPFPFNYSIADAKNPNKRKRNFSRTIELEGTAKNLEFFSSAYQLDLSTVQGTSIAGFNFDPTIRIPASYSKGGCLEFKGLLRLNTVKINNGVKTFVCTLFSDFIELFMALGDLKISELGWSEYDHALTRTNVKNSFATSVMVNGVNTSNFSGGLPLGFGYHYGLVDYGYTRVSPKTFRINDVVPMVYEREVLLKCLEISGITYTSTFIDSTFFKKMLIGFGGGDKQTLSATEQANRRTQLSGNTSITIDKSGFNVREESGTFYTDFTLTSLINLLRSDITTPTVTTDIYAQFNSTDGVVTVERTGSYNLNITQTVNSSINSGTMTYVQGTQQLTYVVKRNGAVISQPSIPSYSGVAPSIAVTVDLQLQLNAGDTITIELIVLGTLTYELTGDVTTLDNLTLSITDSPNLAFDLTSQQSVLIDGDTVELSRFIPEMKASDFLDAAIMKYNLYTSDPDVLDVVTIEPLTDFYKPTSQFDDWSLLLDHSKDVEIEPASMIEGKQYRFKWAEDNDYDNKRYRERFGIGYGDYNYQVESTWQVGNRDYVLPFAQTIPTDNLTPLVVPRIVSVDETTNIVKPFKGKPRCYVWNGLKTGAWRLTDVDGVIGENLTAYPSVHHFDNWQNPAFDLNWGLPQELQYTTDKVTSNNLFTKYHRQFILEMTGRDSKILKAYFKLSSYIVSKLDWGKLKMINGVLFRLNEIKDFNSNSNNTTYCELIKIVEARKPKTFATLTTTKPSKITNGVIISPAGNSGLSATVGVLSGGVPIGVDANTSKIIG